MSNDQADLLFKFIVIGDPGAGKSCILHQFAFHKFRRNSSHTVGVEFGAKTINVGGKTVKLQVWDTAGQERYRAVARSYYRKAAGALVVYDITNRESYNHVINWLNDARNIADVDIAVICVGNKSDLKEQRAVTFLEASRFCQENGIAFIETSALSGENIDETFHNVTRQILAKIESGVLDPSAFSSMVVPVTPIPTDSNTINADRCQC